MALNLTPVTSGRGSRIPLDEIHTEVTETIEEAYAYCKENDNRLETPDFLTKQSAEEWLSDARAYAYQRAAGRLVIIGNTAKGSEKGYYTARFRVEQYVKANTESPPNGDK